jgi:hypothetical protein
MKQIPLLGKHGANAFAIVDDDNYEQLIPYKWTANKLGYAIRREGESIIFMHRQVTICAEDKEIDHINRNKLDNRKENLREISHRDNLTNIVLHKHNTSGVKGVYWHKAKNKWRAYIDVYGKRKYLGSYALIEDAKKARVEAEKENGYLYVQS